MFAIETRHLSRRFGQILAVDDVSLQIERGAIFGLLGPNGSGKSTIIRMLCGVLESTSGDAHVLGFDCNNQADKVKQRIGYMSQKFSLYGDLSVRENLEFYGRIYGLSTSRVHERIAAVLEITSLTDRIDQLAGTLSGGWKQRLALAAALIHEPEVLFLDEPTAGIDPVARRQLWDLLFELSAQGVTLLVTTHYMDEAERCTDVGYLFMSKLLVCGKPEELKQLPEVTPEGTQRWELEIDHPTQRLQEIRQIDGVREATPFGETIHLLTDDALSKDVIPTQLGISPREVSLRQTTATLEDVFVTLTQNAERASAGLSVVESPLQGQEQVAEPATDEAPTEEVATPAHSREPSIKHRTTDGLWAVLIKEFFHLRRQPSTLFFMLVVPVFQTLIFGVAIENQVENIPMVVYDHDGRQQSRELIEAFVNTRRFAITERVFDEASFTRAMTSGRAQVGLRIPANFSDRMVRGEQVQVQVLIDGSNSQVATSALNAAKLLGLTRSVQMAQESGAGAEVGPARDSTGRFTLPLDVRPRLLYNPDLESARFFVPGLVGIILQLVTLFLTAFAIVRERELGTLEQLFVTPVGRAGLLLGKLTPYAIVGLAETMIVLCVMVYLFDVPINGSIILLLALSALFLVCSLALGLLVSTIAKTQATALQFSFLIMLPSVLLSGFMFPRSEMPTIIYWATHAIPVTYFIEILRGIVLRGADLRDLLPHIIGLMVCCAAILGLSIQRFQKKLT